MGLTLGVDIGTSSSKGVLVSADGTLLAQASRPHAVSSPHPGWFEHDAELTWWADFRELVTELLAALAAMPGSPGPIDALAVSGIGPCLLPADADGRPLRAAILYGVDTRATAQIAEQTERLGGGIVLARCGSPLTSQAVGPKFGWLGEHEPKVAEATRRWFMASSYLAFRLTGEYVLDHHSASQSVPLYSLRTNAWIEQWCEQIAPGVEAYGLVRNLLDQRSSSFGTLYNLETASALNLGLTDPRTLTPNLPRAVYAGMRLVF